MLTFVAFVLALALLIAIHEYGHYRVALACGVKVLRFSIGFGRPLYKRVSRRTGIEYVIGSVPLGGYVSMLDERNGKVPLEEVALAFNRQVLWKRAAIVVAGPLANLILAICLYSLVNWLGVTEPKAVISAPAAGSQIERAGLKSGDVVLEIQHAGWGQEVRSFEHLRWLLVKHAIAKQDVDVKVLRASGEMSVFPLKLSQASLSLQTQDPFTELGFSAPFSPATIEKVLPNGAAQSAGLQTGDLVLSALDHQIFDAAQLRSLIRANPGKASEWIVLRDQKPVALSVTPAASREKGELSGRIEAYVGAIPEQVLVRSGVMDAVYDAAKKTWEMALLSVQMVWKMLLGQASLQNLSGPLSIADYAGKSASAGLTQYLAFLALLSVSLGVLNLLPLPVLDGGHLMYYLWEGVTGRAVSEQWMSALQRLGVCILLAMMCIAFINDIGRLFG